MKELQSKGPASEPSSTFPAPTPVAAPQPPPAPARSPIVSTLLCCVYAFCIAGSLLVYGLSQERIMSQPYGDGKDDYFTFSILLVLFSRVVGLLFALVMVIGMGESFYCQAPLWKYVLIAMSTVVPSICQFEALKYVSFTMQILGKSFKMVPMMLWGTCVLGKRHRVLDWLVAFGVTGGVVCFMVSGSIAPKNPAGSEVWGLLLLMSFIVLDGLTSFFQEKLFADHRTSKYNQMLHINLTSAVLSLACLGISGSFKESFAFCQGHPQVYVDASVMSGSAVVAQWFVYSQVHEFGAQAFAATMNLRQIVSVLASYLVFSHPITVAQVAGLSIVFAMLCFQSLKGWCHTQDESKPLLKGDFKAANSTGAILIKRSGLGGCLPCVGGRDAV